MAYTVCVSLVKGGAGKTTTAIALGEAATLGGGRVTVIDADPMGAAVRWAQLAEQSGRPAAVRGARDAGARHPAPDPSAAAGEHGDRN